MLLPVPPLLLPRANIRRGASVGIFGERGRGKECVEEARGEIERLDVESERYQAPEVDTSPFVPDHQVRAQVIELARERRGFVFMLLIEKQAGRPNE